MAKDGIVVQVLYAQYFNDKTDACTSEDWQIIDLDAGAGVSLSKKRRTQFNSLVVDTNKAIKEVVEEVAAGAKTMTLVTADWDVWAPLTGGQFCKFSIFKEIYVPGFLLLEPQILNTELYG